MTGQGELVATEPYTREEHPTKDAWLKARRHGIGASEASAVIGLNPWKSALQLYAEKLELAEPDAAESEAMEWGLLLEPVIAERYAGVTRRQLAPVEPFTIYRSRTHPFMTATFDRLIIGDPRGLGVLQIKTAGQFKAEDWEDEPPVYYQVQTQQEMAIAGATWGSLAVLIGGQRFRYFDLARNDRFLSVLTQREEAFWNRLLAQDPPPVDGSESAREILRRLYPREQEGLVVALPGEFVDVDNELRQLETQGKVVGKRVDELKNKIRAAIGDAETGVLPNNVAWTWRSREVKGYTVDARMDRVLKRKDPK